VKEDVQVLIQH
jgi:hypothetical protein